MLKTKNFSQKSLTNEILRQAQDDGVVRHSETDLLDGLSRNPFRHSETDLLDGLSRNLLF